MTGIVAGSLPLFLLSMCFIPILGVYSFLALVFLLLPVFGTLQLLKVYTFLPHFWPTQLIDALGAMYVSDVILGAVVYFILGYGIGNLICKLKTGCNKIDKDGGR